MKPHPNSTPSSRNKGDSGAKEVRGRYGVPPDLQEVLGGVGTTDVPESVRGAMVDAGWCPYDAPAVTMELYGTLRLKTGCELLALRAKTVSEAAGLLMRAYPVLERLIPDKSTLREHYRFSVNGKQVLTDPATFLDEGDHLLLFSASVGG